MRRTYVAVLGVGALVAAGCGSDDKPPTKAAYIAKADPICVEAKAKAKTYTDKLDALPADAQVKDTVPDLQGALTSTRAFAVKLRALKRPKEDKATLDSYFASLDHSLVAGDQLLAAAKTNDLAKVQQVGASNPELKAERKRIAKQYGFKHCA